jgi:hypothetical protein
MRIYLGPRVRYCVDYYWCTGVGVGVGVGWFETAMNVSRAWRARPVLIDSRAIRTPSL